MQDSKRKRAFLDDEGDNFIRKMPKTFNIAINTKDLYPNRSKLEDQDIDVESSSSASDVPAEVLRECSSTETLETRHDCVELLCLTHKTRAYFVEGSSTLKELENPNCCKLEDQLDIDVESSSSASDVYPLKSCENVAQQGRSKHVMSVWNYYVLLIKDKTRAYFVEGSTHKKLENLNCSKLEDQDIDDESSSSASDETLETYYVEHKVPVRNVVCDKSMAKVIAWNCNPTSTVSYDWDTMSIQFPK